MDGVDEDRDGGHVFRLVLAAVGLVQGAGFLLLAEANWNSQALWLMASGAFCLLAPSTFQLTFGLGPLRRAALASLGFAALISVLAFWMDLRIDWRGATGFDDHRTVFFCALPIITYISWAYLQTWTEQGALRFPYASLFQFAWSNALIAIIAAMFLSVFWLVLLLWWSLFDLVGIHFFKDLFQQPVFAWIVSGGVFGLGIAIARENGKLVPVLRRVVLMLFQVLAPVLAVAALLFLAVLPLTGLSPLWATKSATLVLVCLLFALTLFVNAVVQDGDRAMPFGRWMNWLMAATLLAMPVFAGIAIYAIRLRIGQYGLTPERFIGQLIVVVASLHVLAYAAGVVLRRKAWSGFIVEANPWIAPVVAGLALLMFTPVADPYGYSARDQMARLVAGKVSAEAFDYGYLKFQLGKPGRAALERVRAIKGHPEQAVIDRKLAAIDKATGYWETQGNPNMATAEELPDIRGKLLIRPEGAALPDDALAALNEQRGWAFKDCLKDTEKCGVLVTDINKDGQPEYLFVSSGYALTGALLYKNGDAWTVRDTGMTPTPGEDTKEAVWQAFVAGDTELVQPEYYDIRIGKNRLHY